MNRWLKTLFSGVQKKTLEHDQIEKALLSYIQEDLNDYLSEEFTDLGLTLPQTLPLINNILINNGEDDDLPRTKFIEKKDSKGTHIYANNLIALVNYPLALLNPTNEVLTQDAQKLCEQYKIDPSAIINLSILPLKTEQEEGVFLHIDIPSVTFLPNLATDTLDSLAAIEFLIARDYSKFDANKLDFCFDKDIEGNTIIIVEYLGELTQEDKHDIQDTIRIELPDRITGMPIIMRQIDPQMRIIQENVYNNQVSCKPK